MNIGAASRIVLAITFLAGIAPAVAQSDAMTAQERANLQLVRDWWQDCVLDRQLDRSSLYMSEDYIQHNINFPTGRQGFVDVLSGIDASAAATITSAVQFAKGDFVLLVHNRVAPEPGDPSRTYDFSSYDLMRIENGKIQEHWDYAEKIPGIPRGGAPNGTDFAALDFDYTSSELENIRIANIEFKDILQYGHVELAEQVMAPGYIQHNPNVPNGRDGFVEIFSQFANPEPIRPEWKEEPALILASGPYVFYMFERSRPDPDYPNSTYPVFWFDMVRVEDGLIQEHWDSAMKNPPQ